MTNSERVAKAQKLLFENTCMEIVLDTYCAPDFVEFIGTAGGDAMKYRVYNDGKIYQK